MAMAFHFWYSVAMPSEYRSQISVLVSFFRQVQDGTCQIPLGPRFTLSIFCPNELLTRHLSHFTSSSCLIRDIQQEYNHIKSVRS